MALLHYRSVWDRAVRNRTVRHSVRSQGRRVAPQSFGLRATICVLFAAVITLVVLQYSFRHGRLINFPTYDDVGYFADATDRLNTFYRDGIAGLLNSYWVHPPHSPYSTAMAIGAYLLFGVHDWAPYAMNSLLAIGFFLFVDWLLSGVEFMARMLCLVFLACLPFVAMAVEEFRPDFAVALFTAAGVLIVLKGPFVYGPRRRQIWAGVWLGIALLTKPPVFPQTLALGGAAVFLATIGDWIAAGRRPKVLAIAKAWLAVTIPMLLIAGPHYIHNRVEIIEYIKSILFGKYEQSYAYGGTRNEHLLYYLTGTGGAVMLGKLFKIILGILAAGSLVLFIFGTRRDRVRVVLMACLIFGAYLIPTVNKTKSEYFGLAFDVLLAFSALFMMGRVLRIERTRTNGRLPAGGIATFCVVVLALWNFQWPVRNGNAYAGWEQQRNEMVHQMYDSIVSHTDFYHLDIAPQPDPSVPDDQKVHTRKPMVLFCCRADFNDDVLKYMACQHQVVLATTIHGDTTNPNDSIADFQNADFLFCSEANNPLAANFLPITAIAEPLLDAARNRSEFAQIGKWTFMKSTQSMYLFARRDWTGFTPVSGLGDLEGPLQEFKLHNIRWGFGPATIIKVPVDRDGVYEFYWLARTDFDGQIVKVKLDGKFIGTQTIKLSHHDMSENRFPMALTAGEHAVEFDYAHWHTDSNRPMAVLFEHMNVARLEK